MADSVFNDVLMKLVPHRQDVLPQLIKVKGMALCAQTVMIFVTDCEIIAARLHIIASLFLSKYALRVCQSMSQ